MSETMHKIYQSIVDGQMDSTAGFVQEALDEGIDPSTVLNEGMISAMRYVGQLFEEGEYYVPEMLVAARAMKNGLGILRPLLVEKDVEPVGKVVVGTVKGDLHDIGKNLVAMMLEGAGYEIIDLGTNVDASSFLEAVQDGAQVIGMSALLTTTMRGMKEVIEAVKNSEFRYQVKVIVGGAPITQDFADQIEADAFAADASSAVREVNRLLA